MVEAIKDFVIGMGSLFDLSGNFDTYTPATDPLRADAEALRSDWEQVGADMRAAINECVQNAG